MLLVAGLVVPVVGVAGAAPASAAVPSFESSLLSLTNADRARAGLAPLQSSSTLVSVARSWSDHMAATGSLGHNPSLTSRVSGWSSLGENVAMAYSASQTESLFMGSSGHRANILNAKYNRVGIGVTKAKNGAYWITVDFEQTSGFRAASGTRTTTVHHPSTTHTVSTRSSSATRSSRSAVRAAPAQARPAAVRPAVVTVSAAAVALNGRLAFMDARSATTGTAVGLLSAASVAPPVGSAGSDPAVLVVLGGLAVTALAGAATARPARVRVRNRFRRGAGA